MSETLRPALSMQKLEHGESAVTSIAAAFQTTQNKRRKTENKRKRFGMEVLCVTMPAHTDEK